MVQFNVLAQIVFFDDSLKIFKNLGCIGIIFGLDLRLLSVWIRHRRYFTSTAGITILSRGARDLVVFLVNDSFDIIQIVIWYR